MTLGNTISRYDTRTAREAWIGAERHISPAPASRSALVSRLTGTRAEITPAARQRDHARRCGYRLRSHLGREVYAATGAVLRVGAVAS